MFCFTWLAVRQELVEVDLLGGYTQLQHFGILTILYFVEALHEIPDLSTPLRPVGSQFSASGSNLSAVYCSQCGSHHS